MASDKPVLEISNLHVGIDDTPILRGINLEIPAGEIHAIMANGSGKTTTANIIMGHPDFDVTDGSVELDGEDLLEMEPWERAREEFSFRSNIHRRFQACKSVTSSESR